MIVDAVSWRIIADDIKDLYHNKTLPEKTSSYRQWLNTVNIYPKNNSEEREHWVKQLEDYSENSFLKTVTEPSYKKIKLIKNQHLSYCKKFPGHIIPKLMISLLLLLHMLLKQLIKRIIRPLF